MRRNFRSIKPAFCVLCAIKNNKASNIHQIFVTVVSQSYTVNLWEENVLRGNSAILKCHIPSFVTEFVMITSWIISEGDTDEMEIHLHSDFSLGNRPNLPPLPSCISALSKNRP